MEQNAGEGLYTKAQMDYVNGLSDDELRSHLLHQVRLRDNMEFDRNSFEKIANTWPTLQGAISKLQSELNVDKSEGSYYYSWQANIAMAFYDEVRRQTSPKGKVYNMYDETFGDGALHEAANNAAKNFLDLLIAQSEPPKQ